MSLAIISAICLTSVSTALIFLQGALAEKIGGYVAIPLILSTAFFVVKSVRYRERAGYLYMELANRWNKIHQILEKHRFTELAELYAPDIILGKVSVGKLLWSFLASARKENVDNNRLNDGGELNRIEVFLQQACPDDKPTESNVLKK
jgi:hypothetical protein